MLETERLILRPITPNDLDSLIELRADPHVNRYIGGTRMQSAEAIEKRLEFYVDCHQKYGFGFCMMDWKATGETVGWSGLQPLAETTEIEVGYGMAKKFWGKGIGTECAKAWLEYGFKHAGLERIVALAVPENTGSWHIMEKLGMQFEGVRRHYGLDCKFYAISKAEFLRLH